MKQHITKEQWCELNKYEQDKYIGALIDKDNMEKGITVDNFKHRRNCKQCDSIIYPSIGQMIEFLGDDWMVKCNFWSVEDFVDNNELCDSLWEAVKYKLNEKTNPPTKTIQKSR